MKKTLLLLSLFILILACKKEEAAHVETGPVIVLDQLKVEENIAGTWKGVITGTNGATENMEVTVQKMIKGNKVGAGK